MSFQGAPRGGLEHARPSVGGRWSTDGTMRGSINAPAGCFISSLHDSVRNPRQASKGPDPNPNPNEKRKENDSFLSFFQCVSRHAFVRSFVEPSAPLRRLAIAISAHAGRARAGAVHLGETKTVGRQGVKRERTNERSKYLGDGGGSGCAWICQKN